MATAFGKNDIFEVALGGTQEELKAKNTAMMAGIEAGKAANTTPNFAQELGGGKQAERVAMSIAPGMEKRNMGIGPAPGQPIKIANYENWSPEDKAAFAKTPYGMQGGGRGIGAPVANTATGVERPTYPETTIHFMDTGDVEATPRYSAGTMTGPGGMTRNVREYVDNPFEPQEPVRSGSQGALARDGAQAMGIGGGKGQDWDMVLRDTIDKLESASRSYGGTPDQMMKSRHEMQVLNNIINTIAPMTSKGAYGIAQMKTESEPNKFDTLALKNRALDIEESYKNTMGKYYGEKLGLDKEELNWKKSTAVDKLSDLDRIELTKYEDRKKQLGTDQLLIMKKFEYDREKDPKKQAAMKADIDKYITETLGAPRLLQSTLRERADGTAVAMGLDGNWYPVPKREKK